MKLIIRLRKHYEGMIVKGDRPQTLRNLERDADNYAHKDDGRALSEYVTLGVLYSLDEDKKSVQRVGNKGKKVADRIAVKSGKSREQVIEDLALALVGEIAKKEGLGKRLAEVVGVIGILGGLFVLSPSLTGNVIANLTNSTSSFLGVVFLIVGLVGAFFWVKK